MAVDTDEQSSTGTDQPPDQVVDWLADVLPAWVDDGLISSEQAEAIRGRHGLDEPQDSATTQSRLVTAVSIIGAALVGTGLIVFLGTNWAAIPRFVRTLLLLIVPPTAFGLGYQFTTSRDSPRVGHALWIFGAVFTGPSLVLLDDLYGLTTELTWLLVGWFVVALVAGESFESRPTVGLGVLLAVALVVDLIEPGEPAVPIAMFGLLLVGLSGLRTVGRSSAGGAETPQSTDPSQPIEVDQLAASYRIAGVSILTVGLVWLSTQPYRGDATEMGPVAGAIALGAVATVVLLGVQSRSQPALRPLAVWTVAAGGSVALSTAIGTAVPELLSDLAGFLLIHGLMFGLLLGVVVIGYLSTDATLISVAVGLVFFQLVVVLTSTVADTLPTSLALVVSGSILLSVAIGLERGRRSLLDRL